MATNKSKRNDEDEMDDSEMREEVIDGYKAARNIGNKLFGTGTLTLAQIQHLAGLAGLPDDDLDEEMLEEFEDALRECQADLINLDAGTVTFDEVVRMFIDRHGEICPTCGADFE